MAEDEDGDWVEHSIRARAQYNLSPKFNPWTDKHGDRPQLLGVPCRTRSIEAINIAWGSRPKASRTFPFYCDQSQCVSRHRWGSSFPCLVTNTEAYDYEKDAVVNGFGNLALQGIPTEIIKEAGERGVLTSANAKDLAGEAMFCPCLATVAMGIFLNRHAPWWNEAGGASSSSGAA